MDDKLLKILEQYVIDALKKAGEDYQRENGDIKFDSRDSIYISTIFGDCKQGFNSLCDVKLYNALCEYVKADRDFKKQKKVLDVLKIVKCLLSDDSILND